jgi:Bacterial Ig-like domain (group 1)/Invasin, domain 3
MITTTPLTLSAPGRILSALTIVAALPLFGQVTTYHYDNNRTGATLGESILNTSNVNVNTFGKLFSLPVDGEIYAQPLYVPGVAIPQNGVHNVLYVATEHNSVYAFDAESASAPLWKVNLGPAMPTSTCCWGVELLPEIGITSTPVIDLSTGTLYVVAETYENQVAYFRLHALDLTTGADKMAPAVIQGSVSGNSFDAVNGIVAFNPIKQFQRPGLLLLNGNIYIGFGSHQDLTPFHGWLFGYSASTLQMTGLLCFSPDNGENGLWQGGVGLAADAGGNIYLETGNGAMNVNTGGRDYGDSIVKIGTSNGLEILDYFSPSTQLADQNNDWDLGSSGPVLIPGTSLGVAGGKDGMLYVFNVGNLGQYHSTGDQLAQEWQATYSYSYSPPNPGGFWGGNYIYYNNTLFAFGERDMLKAFSFNGTQFNPVPSSQSTMAVFSSSSNDPAISISANGPAPGTGIVWAAYATSGNLDDGLAHPTIFRAFDASDVSRELWDSGQNPARDTPGNWAKWCPPIVVRGRVYLPTYDAGVIVYGLLAGYESVSATAGTPQSAVVNSAFGTALQVTVKDASNNPLSDVNVTFTVPASGPGASFTGSSTVVTNINGVATAPTLVANGQAGSYTVTAGVPGVATAANFNLTNLPGSPAIVSAIAGTPQSTVVNTAFGVALQVQVKDGSNNPVSGATVTFAAPGSGASATFSGSTTVATNASGLATSPSLTANNLAGSYTVTASVAGVATPAAFNLTNYAAGTGGSLSGAGNSTSGIYNLTLEGPSDWVRWGIISGGPGIEDRKSAVTAQVSDYSVIGSLAVGTINTDPRTLNWSDGMPNASGSDNTGVYIDSNSGHAGNGFSFSVPADTALRTLIVHVGGQDSGGTLTASLSDGSAPNYQDTTPYVAGRYDRNYTITYSAASPGQMLAVRWVNATASGNMSLSGAALSPAQLSGSPSSILASVGTPQSATVNTAFTTALQATVKDASNNPLSGITVVFSAPSSGPSATFGGSASVTTNSSGVATAPPLTANSQPGSYVVTATAAGLGSPANFSLTNVSGPPSSVTATAGTPQSTAINSAFATALAATVKDASGNAVNGVTVTFSAPSTGASATFGGSTTVTTNGSGVATAPPLTANGQTGSYTVTASVAGVATSAGFSLTNLAASPASITATAGTPQSTTVNTAFATALQATVKDGNNNPVSGITVIFAAPASGASATFGGSTTVTTNGSGVATAPSLTANGQAGSYTVTASVAGVATPAGFSLTNLAASPASITATAGTPQSTTVNTAFATTLQATVKDGNNNPVSGIAVIFAAPASGASATFGGSTTVTTNGSGLATAPSLTANGQAGSYTVTASVAGVSSPASYSLTNTAATTGGSGSISASGNSTSGTYSLTSEGTTDWVHWGIISGGPGIETRKRGVAALITNYSQIGSLTVATLNSDARTLNWIDGTPNLSGSDNTGVYVDSNSGHSGNGFSFSIPADTTTRTLIVHVGGQDGGGKLTAVLSDGSADSYQDTTPYQSGRYDRNYTITYTAASSGQTLTITWINATASGNVTLSGAALH